MRFRDRLILIGIILVVVPSGLVMGVYSYIMATRLTADAGMLVRTKLDLLENRVAASHDVLERAGIADNVFYSGVALSAIASAFVGVMAPGESFLVLDADGRVLQGTAAEKGTNLAPEDPLRAALAKARSSEAGEGGRDSTRILRSPSVTSGRGASIVAWRSYEPWASPWWSPRTRPGPSHPSSRRCASPSPWPSSSSASRGPSSSSSPSVSASP